MCRYADKLTVSDEFVLTVLRQCQSMNRVVNQYFLSTTRLENYCTEVTVDFVGQAESRLISSTTVDKYH